MAWKCVMCRRETKDVILVSGKEVGCCPECSPSAFLSCEYSI